MTQYTVNDDTPQIPDSCFIAPNAAVIGDVTLGEDCSVWPAATVRADSDRIRIGDRTNIQDGAVLHTADDTPVTVGESVTIGHQAIVHGCAVEHQCLIGMGARILSNAVIGKHSIIAAGAVVTEGMEVPERSMVMGVPGEIVREVTDEEVERIRENAQIYVAKKNRYHDSFTPVDT